MLSKCGEWAHTFYHQYEGISFMTTAIDAVRNSPLASELSPAEVQVLGGILTMRELKDGEAQPACMQSCPAQAIVFGDVKDPDSQISHAMRDPKRFLVLGELGIGPAVSYLTKIRNAEPAESQGGRHGA